MIWQFVAVSLVLAPVIADEIVVSDTVRVQALSPSLIRIEPIGPLGFEDRTTFMVVNRDFPGVAISQLNQSSSGTWLKTDFYLVFVPSYVNGTDLPFLVASLDGSVLWRATDTDPNLRNQLNWPSPLKAAAYGLTDRPRFHVPAWCARPYPEDAPIPEELKATNGYDYRTDVDGDTYVFLLGSDLNGWHSARAEFLALTGPTPQLPDWAFGAWFTFWDAYTETRAKSEIANWKAGNWPLDIWGLDMNWRNVSDPTICRNMKNDSTFCVDHFYDHPATELFPDYSEWFDYLKTEGLRTYFNDHPFPQDYQTFKKEIDFRWQGLSGYINKGLTFWWFDHNWGFSIPPPNLAPNTTFRNVGDVATLSWRGLTAQAWGSHVYYTSMWSANNDSMPGTRGLALSRMGGPNWASGMSHDLAAQVPGVHRYPVWWTGDGVSMRASIESMTDQGIHSFMPYVHSDCGGHQDGPGPLNGLYTQYTAHCVFGSIVRFHQGEHRPWHYPNDTQDVIRNYLNVRYKMIPSLITQNAESMRTGFPTVIRGDVYWPEHPEAGSNDQYLFLNDTLIAPLYSQTNRPPVANRSVWIPPGQWVDAWSGQTVTGPVNITASPTPDKIPMWHRVGGLIVCAFRPGLRVEDQDWSHLTVEAFPSQTQSEPTLRALHPPSAAGPLTRTGLTMSTDHAGVVNIHIGQGAEGHASRMWTVRVHLPGSVTKLSDVSVDGQPVSSVVYLPAVDGSSKNYFPFGGAGSSSVLLTAEFTLAPLAADRVLTFTLN